MKITVVLLLSLISSMSYAEDLEVKPDPDTIMILASGISGDYGA